MVFYNSRQIQREQQKALLNITFPSKLFLMKICNVKSLEDILRKKSATNLANRRLQERTLNSFREMKYIHRTDRKKKNTMEISAFFKQNCDHGVIKNKRPKLQVQKVENTRYQDSHSHLSPKCTVLHFLRKDSKNRN